MYIDMDKSGKARHSSTRLSLLQSEICFYVIVVGLDQESKCQILNAMSQNIKTFTVMECKTKLVIRKTNFTLLGKKVTLVQTPSLNTPAWVKVKEKLLTNERWRDCKPIFVYVKAFQTTADDEELFKMLRDDFEDRILGVNCYKITAMQNTITPNTNIYQNLDDFQLIFGINAAFNAQIRETNAILSQIKAFYDVAQSQPATHTTPEVCDAEVDARRKTGKVTQQLGDEAVDTAYCDKLVATVDVPSSEEGVPRQIKKVEMLKQEDWDRFGHALNYGSASSKHVRVNVVGNHGVGKTTLIKRLLGKKTKCPDPNPVPTENLDIHRVTARCEERNGVKRWQTSDHDFFLKELNIHRMAQAIIASENIDRDTSLDETCSDLDFSVEEPSQKLSKDDQDGSSISPTAQTPIKTGRPNKKPEFMLDVSLKQDAPNDDPDLFTGSDEIQDESPDLRQSSFFKPIASSSQSDLSILRSKEEYLKQVLYAKQDIEKENVERLYVSYWDYAGQATYYATHHLFLSPLAVYLLVFDLRQELNELVTDNLDFRTGVLKKCTVAETLKFWVRSIQSYTKDEFGGHSPFIIVGTHKANISEKDIQNKFKEVRTLLKANAECIAVDNDLNVEKDETFDVLKDKIVDNSLGVIDEKVSSQWINLEYDMQRSYACQTGYIKFTELQELDRKLDVPMNDTARLECFLAHQHYRGQLLFYQDTDLKSLIITDPMLLVQFLNKLLRHSESGKKTASDWNEDGILNHNFINKIKDEIGVEDYACTAFVKILVKMNILHPLSSSNMDEKMDQYFLPCLLPDTPCDDTDIDECDQSSLFKIHFDHDSIHQTTYHQIICALLKSMSLIDEEGQKQIHNLQACFDLRDDNFVWLVIFWKHSKVFFYVKDFDQDKARPISHHIDEVIEKLNQALEDVLFANQHENVTYSFYVQCPKHQGKFMDLQKLKCDNKAMCPGDKSTGQGRHAVRIEDVNDVTASSIKEEENPEMLQRPTDQILSRLAWKLHGRETTATLSLRLKLPGALTRADVISRDYKDPGSELFHVLYTWRNNRETNRTYKYLLDVFTKRRDYDEAVLKNAMFPSQSSCPEFEDIPNHSSSSYKDIALLSRHIGTGYTFVLLECGIDWARIQQERQNHINDTSEMIRRLLCDWRNKDPVNSTTKRLLQAAKMYDIPLDQVINELKAQN